MKKLLLICVMLLVAVSVQAEPVNLPELITKMPSVEQGVVYNISEKKWQPMTSVPLITWKMLSISGGYVGPDKAALSLSVDLIDMANHTTLPVLKHLNLKPAVFYSIDRLFDDKSDDSYGVGSTIFSVNF